MGEKMKVPYGEYEFTMGSLFDLKEDKNGALLMPFTPADYGEDNAIPRDCDECGEEHPQGEMKELGRGSLLGSGIDQKQLYIDGIFVCERCWFKKYADASQWRA